MARSFPALLRPALCCLLLLGAGMGPAHAQGTRQPGASSDAMGLEENRKEVRQMADALGIPQQIEAIWRQVRAEMVRATMEASGHPEDEAGRIVDDVMVPNFRARLPELENELVEIYAQGFNFTDLRALRTFYSTPLGQKLLRVVPQAQAQGAQLGLAWGQRVFQDSVDRHADELRARGLKF